MNTDSTRKLYEKKLEVAMENAPVEPSSDKTYYREEGRRLSTQSAGLQRLRVTWFSGHVVGQ